MSSSLPVEERKACILVVDDEQAIRLMVSRFLIRRDYTVLTATNAAEALSCLEQQQIDIVLLDLVMPGMDGLRLAELVRFRFPHVALLVMTAYASVESAAASLRLGAVDYLLKPFGSLELVLAAINRIEEKRRLECALALHEAQLLESRASLSSIVEKSNDGLLVIDQEQHIRYANEMAARLLDRPLAALLEQEFWLVCENDEVHEVPIKRLCGELGVAELRGTHTEWDGQPATLIVLQDVSARKAVEKGLQQSEERYALAAKGSNDGMWDWSFKDNQILYAPRWKEMIGYTEDELSYAPSEWFSRLHPEDQGCVEMAILALDPKGETQKIELEYRIQHRDGTYRWMLCRGLVVFDQRSSITRVVGSQTDITKRREGERLLVDSAKYDPLTGLANRLSFIEQLTCALQDNVLAMENKRQFAVMFLDLDRFKTINDSLGHMIGDRFLQTVAARLLESVRDCDTVARLGGDEFSLLIDGFDEIQDVIEIAERIQHSLSRALVLDEHEIYATVSIGIALSRDGYQEPTPMLRDADTAMFRAKASGKACYALFDREMHQQAVSRLWMEAALRRAIERNEFSLQYQPIVDITNGEIHGAEALLRWTTGRGERIAPSRFIPVLEETGMIKQVGIWVIEKVCAQLREWRLKELIYRDFPISVNLSPKQMSQNGLFEALQRCLLQADIQPHEIKLEITESLLVEHDDAMNTLLRRLQEYGLHLHLDDFGTGFSSLRYLHRFPISVVKIDRSFVKQMTEEAEHREIVRTIVELSQILKKSVIGEGVEEIEQLKMLQEFGCRFAQGYFFARPLEPLQIEALLVGELPWASVFRAFETDSPSSLPEATSVGLVDDEASHTHLPEVPKNDTL